MKFEPQDTRLCCKVHSLTLTCISQREVEISCISIFFFFFLKPSSRKTCYTIDLSFGMTGTPVALSEVNGLMVQENLSNKFSTLLIM